ncbi:MAG: type II toxin-antitoxin system RelE/ParE family toxin [Candidatus Aminicenantes bacterium]|nr:type II toxin-antitoxin system RelE/ParE family toxin [Candidatus Aminicenantes bacterium]
MKLLETSKFSKLRKKIRDEAESVALKSAIGEILKDPQIGKKLKGELGHLRSYSYTARGQTRRLIYHWYHWEKNEMVLFSFGPRQGIYKN